MVFSLEPPKNLLRLFQRDIVKFVTAVINVQNQKVVCGSCHCDFWYLDSPGFQVHCMIGLTASVWLPTLIKLSDTVTTNVIMYLIPISQLDCINNPMLYM